MTYLICYDISDDALRTRLSKRLDKAGCVRLQKSVFMAPDFDVRRLTILRGGIMKLLPPTLSPDESVIVIPIEKNNLSDIVWQGDVQRITGILRKDLLRFM